MNSIKILDAVAKRKIATFHSPSESKSSNPLAVGDGNGHVNTNSTVSFLHTNINSCP